MFSIYLDDAIVVLESYYRTDTISHLLKLIDPICYLVVHQLLLDIIHLDI